MSHQTHPKNEQLLMLGSQHKNYGSFASERLGRAIATISVGRDPSSPSMAAKARKDQPNEDGLLVVKRGSRYLLAVADGHFGNQTSHALLKRLSRKAFPESQALLVETLQAVQRPPLTVGSGSTLTVAVYDEETGNGFGVSTGDSPLCTIAGQSFQEHTINNTRFVYFNKPLALTEWQQFRFRLSPGGLLLLHTDGINECHYRSPETSITPNHILTLWQHTAEQPEIFCKLLTQLALDGINGNPGGEDNIALIVLQRPPDASGFGSYGIPVGEE